MSGDSAFTRRQCVLSIVLLKCPSLNLDLGNFNSLEFVWMIFAIVAVSTEIELLTHKTAPSDALDGVLITVVTLNAEMNIEVASWFNDHAHLFHIATSAPLEIDTPCY